MLFRMGFDQGFSLGKEGPVAALRFGVALHNIHYWLDQMDHVQLSSRSLEEDWTEWTPTWGFGLNFSTLNISYRGSITNGTGRPGVFGGGDILRADAPGAALQSNILVAPSGPLTMSEVKVTTHQITISLPLR
jgi:hypothetical protein